MIEQTGIRTQSGEILALKEVGVCSRIAGLLARTTLRQRYRNDTGANLEVAYTFPLPVDAVLLDFSVRIGERIHQGEVVARRQAEDQYEHALETGHSAFRLQALAKGLYGATLGNVLPGETVELQLAYAEPLSWNGRSLRFRLPTTLAPRYGEPIGLEPWQRPSASLAAEYALAVTVEFEGELARASIESPSHRIRVHAADGRLVARLADGAVMDRDFLLDIRCEAVHSLGVAASALDAHVAMVTVLPPPLPTAAHSARNAVIVLDCSGSMAGDSIALAKEGVRLALQTLTASDRFGLIGFGSRFVAFDPALRTADRSTVDAARRFVADLPAMGGTELESALEAALVHASDASPLDILLLTDGEAWKLGDVIAKAKTTGARIFTLGIGSAVAEDTVRRLADETGGACELVAPNDDMAERIARHFERMRQPRIDEVSIAWPRTPRWETRPARACFAGDAWTVFAAFDEPVSGQLTAGVRLSGRKAREISIALAHSAALAASVVRVAANARLPSLAPSDRQAWAVRHQLVTPETDYLVSLRRTDDERSNTLPELHVVPQMLAAGWGGSGTVVGACAALLADGSSMGMYCCAPDYDVPDALSAIGDDIPAVLRSGHRSGPAPMPSPVDAGFRMFLDALDRRSGRRIPAGLPLTRAELERLGCPDRLLALVDDAIRAGLDEPVVVLSLYAALADSACRAKPGETFVRRVERLRATGNIDAALAERFSAELEELWEEAAARPTPDDREIPAFLRGAAD